MNSKERFDMYVKSGLKKPHDDIRVIESLVNTLIEALYLPIEGEKESVIDESRLKMFGVDTNEPINWADLKCCDVKRVSNEPYLVTVDEASPSGCTTLCDYIEKFVQSWGWNVTVETEW